MSATQQQEEYARIVTNANQMEELLSLVRLHGTDTDGSKKSLVKDTVLTFEDGHVDVKLFDPMASVWGHVRGPFDGVRGDGQLVIGSIEDFLTYLSRFGEHTQVTVEEREGSAYVTFDDEDRKSGAYPADDITHIDSIQNVDQLPFSYDPEEGEPSEGNVPMAGDVGVSLDTWFRCDVAEIQDVLDDGDTTDVREYPIMVDDGSVQIRVGDHSGWIETDFVADVGEGEAASVYAYGMDNTFSNLEGQVTLFLSDDNPMWIHCPDHNGYTVDYMVAEDTD